MGQLLDYIASVFTSKVENMSSNTTNHVSFADNSFTQVFSRDNSAKAEKLASLNRSNRQTIHIYQWVGVIAFLLHLGMVTWTKIQTEEFDLLKQDAWQLMTMSFVPLIVYVASIGAMNQVVQPPSKSSRGFDINDSNFVTSLKIMIVLMAICQVSSIYSDRLIWLVVMIVPIWCYQLTSVVAQSEHKRVNSSPKKQWMKVGSPKQSSTPSKETSKAKQQNQRPQQQQQQQQQQDNQATPRTRTKRAVKNLITGVSDKYHAFEQNVAHKISQKIFSPLNPKLKMIDSWDGSAK